MLVPLLLLLDDQPQPPQPITVHEQGGGGAGKDFWYDITDLKYNISGRKESHYLSRPFHYVQNNPKTEEEVAAKIKRIRERVRIVERVKVINRNIYIPVAQKQLASLVDRKSSNIAKALITTGLIVGFISIVSRK